MRTLGIDTSNYTTSVAVFDSESGTVVQQKKLLPVKEGEKGLRQSDAVFHHTAQLYPLMEALGENLSSIDAIGVSTRPRDAEGSYMPCFTVGINVARCVGAALSKPVYSFSHQCGHIAAALYSANRLDLLNEEFIAFHVSGGTTEMLHVLPDSENIMKVELVGKTLDLNAGQAVDRTGVMLGMKFPCGKELDALARQSEKTFNPKVSVSDGDCCLSGVENQVKKMIADGEEKRDICRYCIDFTAKTLEKMTEHALSVCGDLPIIYAGGVMSNSIIRERFEKRFGALFAAPEFSCDNAAGVAILTYERSVRT